MPAQKTLSVWKGNTFELPLVLKTSAGTPVDLTGSSLVFIAKHADGEIRKETGVDAGFVITNAVGGAATLTLSVAETRTIPTGDDTRFEIERRVGGKQITLLFGKLLAAGWVNDD